jgi:hypothetical protein
MKKNLKSLIFVMMVAFSLTASAQKIVVGPTNDFEACRFYLVENPLDTIVNENVEVIVLDDPGKFSAQGIMKGDTLYRDTIVYVMDGRVKRLPRYTQIIKNEVKRFVYDGELVAKVDHVAAQTQTAEKLAEGKKREIMYYQSSIAAETDGKIVRNAADSYGWGMPVEVSYRNGKDLSGVSAAIGGSYSFSWGRADLLFRFARSRFTENANNAGGHYNTYGARLGGHFKVLSFDEYKTWNLYAGGGVGMDWFQTDSRETVEYGLLQSKGSDPYGFAELTVSKRFFATGWEVYGKIGWEQAPSIYQNSDTQYTNCFKITLGVNVPLLRHFVKTRLK